MKVTKKNSKKATSTIRAINTFKVNYKINDSKFEKGSALLETTIVLPLLILVVLGIFDFGRMYFTHSMVSEIAREAALVGAKIPDLEGNQPDGFFEHDLNNTDLPDGLGAGHEIIRSRIRVARSILAKSFPVPIASITSRSQCQADMNLDVVVDGVNVNSGRALTVQVEVDYQPIYLSALPPITISAQEVTSYLGSSPCNPV